MAAGRFAGSSEVKDDLSTVLGAAPGRTACSCRYVSTAMGQALPEPADSLGPPVGVP